MIAQAGVMTWPEWLALVVIGLSVFLGACYWMDERPRRRRQREWEADRLRRRERGVEVIEIGRRADGVIELDWAPPTWAWPQSPSPQEIDSDGYPLDKPLPSGGERRRAA